VILVLVNEFINEGRYINFINILNYVKYLERLNKILGKVRNFYYIPLYIIVDVSIEFDLII